MPERRVAMTFDPLCAVPGPESGVPRSNRVSPTVGKGTSLVSVSQGSSPSSKPARRMGGGGTRRMR